MRLHGNFFSDHRTHRKTWSGDGGGPNDYYILLSVGDVCKIVDGGSGERLTKNIMGIIEERERRTKWFMHDRFGMFIHWGLYAIPGRGEWVQGDEQITQSEYEKYFDEWDPVRCDMKEWARAARQAGMKYAILTTKHHEGFCLFDSQYTDYKSTNTRCHRDFVREFVDAFCEEGLKVGFYYSLLDWHHPDYPAYGDLYHPDRNHEAYREKQHDFDRYLKYFHDQVGELLTNYGKIDLMWFDFSYEGHCGKDWKGEELLEAVRSLQPDIIINGRLEANGEDYGSVMTDNPTIYSGDFACPEMIIPPPWPSDSLRKENSMGGMLYPE